MLVLAAVATGSLIGRFAGIASKYQQYGYVELPIFKKPPVEKKITAIEQQNNLETDEDAYNNPLIVKRRAAIKAKAQEVFAELNISNVHNKTPEEQRQTAFKLLTYLNRNPKIFCPNEITNQDLGSKNQYRKRINQIYYLLCKGLNTDISSADTYTLNLLYRMCGIDCNEINAQNYFNGQPAEKRKFLLINFADGKSVCDPTKKIIYMNSDLIDKVYESLYFMTEDTFREKYNDYDVKSIDEPISLKGFIEPDDQLMQLR